MPFVAFYPSEGGKIIFAFFLPLEGFILQIFAISLIASSVGASDADFLCEDEV